jgi:pimeloyl-ACP methyl ester carboxylesterase
LREATSRVVVALAPWGSDFFRLVRENPAVFGALPSAIHAAVVRAYISGASHRGLSPGRLDALVAPWLSNEGQAAFYRQIAQADQTYTDDIQSRYPKLDLPALIVWGTDDVWIPVDRAHALAELIPGAKLRLMPDAGHLIQFDQPERLAVLLHEWLSGFKATRDA